MKNAVRLTIFIVAFISLYPVQGHAAIAKQQNEVALKQNAKRNTIGKSAKWRSFKVKMAQKWANTKGKIKRWVSKVLINIPAGNLLTSLVLLFVAILLFAISGATKFGLVFGILGSVAIIGALIFFMIWLTQQSKAAKPIN